MFDEDERDGCGHGAPADEPDGDRCEPGRRSAVRVRGERPDRPRPRPDDGHAVGRRLSDLRRLLRRRGDEALPARDGDRRASSVALSPDGQNVYVTSWGSDAVAVLAPGPTVSALRSTRRGLLSVRVTCPALHAGDCAGRMTFSPAAPLRRLASRRPTGCLPAAPGLSTCASHNRSCGSSRSGKRWPQPSTQPMRPATSHRRGERSSSGTAQHQPVRVPRHVPSPRSRALQSALRAEYTLLRRAQLDGLEQARPRRDPARVVRLACRRTHVRARPVRVHDAPPPAPQALRQLFEITDSSPSVTHSGLGGPGLS